MCGVPDLEVPMLNYLICDRRNRIAPWIGKWHFHSTKCVYMTSRTRKSARNCFGPFLVQRQPRLSEKDTGFPMTIQNRGCLIQVARDCSTPFTHNARMMGLVKGSHVFLTQVLFYGMIVSQASLQGFKRGRKQGVGEPPPPCNHNHRVTGLEKDSCV